jgi:hypothetical protein
MITGVFAYNVSELRAFCGCFFFFFMRAERAAAGKGLTLRQPIIIKTMPNLKVGIWWQNDSKKKYRKRYISAYSAGTLAHLPLRRCSLRFTVFIL